MEVGLRKYVGMNKVSPSLSLLPTMIFKSLIPFAADCSITVLPGNNCGLVVKSDQYIPKTPESWSESELKKDSNSVEYAPDLSEVKKDSNSVEYAPESSEEKTVTISEKPNILEVEKDVTEEKTPEEGTPEQNSDNSSTDTSSSNDVKKINL